MRRMIDTEEARRLDYIFCAEYGCINVVPTREEADRQGWEEAGYYYRGWRRRCPGPHIYAWEYRQPRAGFARRLFNAVRRVVGPLRTEVKE